MPAYSEEYPWISHYGHYDFFEERMQSHNRVSNIVELATGIYNIKRDDGVLIKTFICECYSFGIAEYMEVKQNLSDINAVIINSNWCGFTTEAKRHCRNSYVGLFKIAQFMGALNQENYSQYLDKDEKKLFLRNRWL